MSTEPLFRREALEHSAMQAAGTTILRVPPGLNVAIGLFVTFAILTSLIALFTDFPRTETVTGILAPTSGMTKVTSSVSGTIAQTMVHVGDLVKTGQLLAVISPDVSLAGGRSTILELLSAAERRKTEIISQIAVARFQNKLQVDRLAMAIEGQNHELSALSEEISLRKSIVKRLHDQASVALHLAGVRAISTKDAQDSQNRFDEASIEMAALQRESAKLESDILVTRSEMNMSLQELEQTRSKLNMEKLDIEAEIARFKGQTSVEVLSPAAGILDYAALQQGQSAAANTLLFSVVPRRSDLQAEIFVSSGAIASIKLGQEVRIEYDAFPSVHYGFARAKINSTNETLLGVDEAHSYGIIVDEPVYRIIAVLSDQTMQTQLEKLKLKSGMKFSAQAFIEDHWLVTWMWRKLLRTWWAR